MKSTILLAAMLSHSALASSPADFATEIPILTDGSSAAWQVELDSNAYRWAQTADLRDVAIFNAAGQPVPFAPWRPGPVDTVEERHAQVPVFELSSATNDNATSDMRLLIERDAKGRLHRVEAGETTGTSVSKPVSAWLLDTSEFDHGIDSLSLQWSEPSDGLIAQFDVDGSDDLQRWQRLRSEATIVLLRRDGMQVERREILLDGARHRYLRLRRIDKGPAFDSLQVEAGKRVRGVDSVVAMQWLDAQVRDAIDNVDRSDVHHLYEIAATVPASELAITLAGDNALADLELLVPQDAGAGKTRWIGHGHLVAFRLRQDGITVDSDALPIAPAQRLREFRIDSATPLKQAPKIRVGFFPARLAFLAEGEGPYVLAVGSARARHPDYPVAAAISSLRGRLGPDWQPPIAHLGTAMAAADMRALVVPKKPYDWKQMLLWGVLILAAAVVGAIAVNLLRAGQRGAEDGQQPPEE